MVRWTARYLFPAKQSTSSSHSVRIRNDIWTIPVILRKTPIIVFETETRKFEVIKFPIPENVPYFVYHCFSHNDQIYMWCSSEGDMMLHRLDPQTLQWDYIMRSSNKYSSCIILGNIMYGLFRTELQSNTFHLDILDLDSKERVSRKTLGDFERFTCLKLISNNEKVYLIQYSVRSGTRTVSVYEYGTFKMIHEETFETDESMRTRGCTGCSNDLFRQTANNTSATYLSRFNFSKNEWQQTKIEKCWVRRSYERLCDFIEIDDIIYVILNDLALGREMRLLELIPKLSTFGLLNGIDDFFPKNKMDAIARCEKLLPVSFRDEWNGILSLRVIQQDEILSNQFGDAAKAVFEKMMQDGEIDGDEQKYLTRRFQHFGLWNSSD